MMRIAGKRVLAAAVIFAALTAGNAAAVSRDRVMDKESEGCVSCHEGTVSSHHKLSVCDAEDCDHPIGGNYEDLSAGDNSLRPANALNPAFKLIDGRISCVTCHVPYSNPEKHKALADLRKRYPIIPDPMLVVDNRGSGLCLACHVK